MFVDLKTELQECILGESWRKKFLSEKWFVLLTESLSNSIKKFSTQRERVPPDQSDDRRVNLLINWILDQVLKRKTFKRKFLVTLESNFFFGEIWKKLSSRKST